MGLGFVILSFDQWGLSHSYRSCFSSEFINGLRSFVWPLWKTGGIVSNEIYDITQGKTGRIWVATSKGLVTLEGLSFELVKSSKVLKGWYIVGFLNRMENCANALLKECCST